MELTCLFRVVLQKMSQITDENTSPKIVQSTHYEDSIDPGLWFFQITLMSVAASALVTLSEILV